MGNELFVLFGAVSKNLGFRDFVGFGLMRDG
jgi:hypothetical protein